MTANQTIRIDLPAASRSYDIHVGAGLLDKAGELIAAACGVRRIVVVTDSNVAPLYLARTETALTQGVHTLLPSITIPAGEASKSFATLQDLLSQLFARQADRKTLIVALGGGVIGDLAGFAASIALRGMDIVQIPTTLLSQVDSSVGGKTGINSAHGKNTIGAFYQPRLVLADVSTLATLPPRQVISGFGEVVKYGLIQDPAFFDWCLAHGDALLSGDASAQSHAVAQSCAYKAAIVAQDEREAGRRALLNLGHTFGHALESVTGYSDALLHGEAVSIGLAMAFDLSARLGLCSAQTAQHVRTSLQTMGLPATPPQRAYDLDRLMSLMAQDKKAESGRLTLILARGIGQAFVAKDVDPAPVRQFWQDTIG